MATIYAEIYLKKLNGGLRSTCLIFINISCKITFIIVDLSYATMLCILFSDFQIVLIFLNFFSERINKCSVAFEEELKRVASIRFKAELVLNDVMALT